MLKKKTIAVPLKYLKTFWRSPDLLQSLIKT